MLAHPVHPHMRGRLTQAHPRGWNSTGSSPHAWETLTISFVLWVDHRFIPTCVGDSSLRSAAISSNTVHPHMRGRLLGIFDTESNTPRFIPTCVGDSATAHLIKCKCAVHPHMRGRLYSFKGYRLRLHGSSPLAWETQSVSYLSCSG